MVGVLVVALGLSGLLVATTTLSTVELQEAQHEHAELRAKMLAESGYERGVLLLETAVENYNAAGPIQGLRSLFAASKTIQPFTDIPLTNGDGTQVGETSVSMTSVQESDSNIQIEIETTGYIPRAPGNLLPGERLEAWHSISVTVEYSLGASDVFDYAYFINNWGWLYGSTIVANGNIRSNGQMDFAGYKPTVNNQPTYDSVDWNGVTATLSGYRDTNGDKLQDGEDGGVFSGWDIVAAQNVRGNGGESRNQHDFEDRVDMPNLTDLTPYRQKATTHGSSITIGGTQVSDAVYGDGVRETGNLYLEGTAANPIVLDGPVVIEGDVIIKGYVTGQGAIYAGGNVYVPDSIQYVDPPTSPRPAGSTQADTELWLSDNWNKDFLGLFATENVVVGDHTNSSWRSWVGGWMTSTMNSSKEDSGEDGIPNTSKGKDGIAGTADDDVLENDGTFTTDYYTAQDQTLGIIPPGKNVGDRVPGTGEDIDGDGLYDHTTGLSEIDFSTQLNTTNWGGNMPAAGISNYSSVASMYASRLDATFYTNHSFCYVVLGSTPAEINGSLVCRNENIVYGTPTISFNHDSRLLGGNKGLAGPLLPQSVAPMEVLRWVELDRDPHRAMAQVVTP